jgi:hypothetical protein
MSLWDFDRQSLPEAVPVGLFSMSMSHAGSAATLSLKAAKPNRLPGWEAMDFAVVPDRGWTEADGVSELGKRWEAKRSWVALGRSLAERRDNARCEPFGCQGRKLILIQLRFPDRINGWVVRIWSGRSVSISL